MNKKHFKHKITKVLMLSITFSTLFSAFLMSFNALNAGVVVDGNPLSPDIADDLNLGTSGVTQVGSTLPTNTNSWWNETFSKRIGIQIENNLSFDRYEPVDVSLSFDASSFYKGTERLIPYDNASNTWSDPIPVQVYNEDATPYITSCNMVFMANVSANSNSTYFLYYHVNDVGIDISYSYNTGFESGISGNALTVKVTGGSTDVEDYKVVLRQGVSEGASTLIKGTDLDLGPNYHSTLSLAPEIIVAGTPLGSLALSAHLDEPSGTDVSAVYASGSLPDGLASADGFTDSGVTNGAFDFEQSSSDAITFTGELSVAGEPFHEDSSQWTMMCWIKPESIGSTTSTSEGTRNAFASYSLTNKETFEIGINNDGKIRVYIKTDAGENFFAFSPGSQTVTVGAWNFIALRVDLSDETYAVGVCLNDIWEYATAWDTVGGTSMAKEANKNVNIGWATGVYFDGMMDEVQFYSVPLDEATVESYKYSSSSDTLNTETITGLSTVEDGDIFSQYTVNWATLNNMVVQDTCTFYWDYNMWNIERVIYFTAEYDSSSISMIPLNTYYDLTEVTSDHEGCYYMSDNDAYANIDNGVAEWENYSVAYYEPNTNDDAFGIFVQEWTPSVGLSIDYFKGTVVVESNQIKMNSGITNNFSNSPDSFSNKKLTINYWEFVDSVYLSDHGNINGVRDYFGNIYTGLKSPLNQYIYQNESLTYDIAVYVTDHDNQVVDGVDVELKDENGTIVSSTTTDSLGQASFLSVINGSYSVNVSYTDDDFGQTIDIADPITTNDLAGDSNAQNVFIANFSQVNLTSIVINITYVVDGAPEGPLALARVNFTYDIDGSTSVKFSGYKTANTTGATVFRWKNATASGSVTFSVWALGLGWQNNLEAFNDSNGAPELVQLNFTDYAWHEVNATQSGGEVVTYNSSITILDTNYNYITEINVDLEDSFTIVVNYSYVGSNGSSGPISGVVTMNLKIGSTIINTNPITLDEIGSSGIYDVTMDTADLIELGGEAWGAGIDYIAEITGDDTTENNTLEISLNRYATRISSNTLKAYANWFGIISYEVTYEFNNSGTWTGITGASVSYYVVDHGEIFGTAVHVSGGTYKISVNTIKFPETGSYYIHVSATKLNYETLGDDQALTILDISTKLNGSETTLQHESDVYLSETKVFYLRYTDSISDTGLAGAGIAQYNWWKLVDDITVDKGEDVGLADEGNGLYKLDFATAALEVGTYKFEIEIKKANYERRRANIDLNIIKRDFSTTATSIYTVVSGNSLIITICISDELSEAPIDDIDAADITVTFLEQTTSFTHDGGGCYSVIISNIPAGVFLMPEVYTAVINIGRENYTAAELNVAINVGMVEIFPGLPMFWFLMIVATIVFASVTVVTYRVNQIRKIPTFVKKSKGLQKTISSNGKIGDSLMYPSKDAFIAKKFADHWKVHDLDLSNILGVGKGKKAKKPLSGEKPEDTKKRGEYK